IVLEKSPKAWNWRLGRAADANMLLEISPGARFRGYAGGEKNDAWGVISDQEKC
ncbi:hypothetical protein A2U01_0105970, partial [Trifolium medium]|nr:hypothetical protein [Trifolium medium]